MSAGRREGGGRRANCASIVGPLTTIQRSRISFSTARAARTNGRQKEGPVSAPSAAARSSSSSEHGGRLYRKRRQTVEPLFGDTKHNRGIYRFHRRGRTKVRTEWRLLMTTHNLTKLHRHRLAAIGA
jgi:hypothetical protein